MIKATKEMPKHGRKGIWKTTLKMPINTAAKPILPMTSFSPINYSPLKRRRSRLKQIRLLIARRWKSCWWLLMQRLTSQRRRFDYYSRFFSPKINPTAVPQSAALMNLNVFARSWQQVANVTASLLIHPKLVWLGIESVRHCMKLTLCRQRVCSSLAVVLKAF